MGCTRATVKGYQEWKYSVILYILMDCTRATVKGHMRDLAKFVGLRVENIQIIFYVDMGCTHATVKVYQDGKYHIREKLMQKLFEIFKVLQFQKRLYKEILYSLGLHECYSDWIPYIFLPSS